MPQKRINSRQIPSKQERHKLRSAQPRRRMAIERAEKRKKFIKKYEFLIKGMDKFERNELGQLQGLIPLTRKEHETIQRILSEGETISRKKWQDIQEGKTPRDTRSLKEVSAFSNTDYVKLVETLHQRFGGQEIKGLYEGSGFSTFAEELEKECEKKGIKIKVFKTDIYPKQRFEQIAKELNETEPVRKRGVQINTENYVQATPEMLAQKFGKNSIHLVVSCLGGLTYTPIPQEKGISNVCQILAPQGEAVITSQPSDLGGKTIRLDILGDQTKTGKYFQVNKKYHAQQEVFLMAREGTLANASRIRIRKNKPTK